MRKPKFIRRIQDWFIKSKSDLPETEPPVFMLDAPVLVPSAPPVHSIIPPKPILKSYPSFRRALPTTTTPPMQKFPILLLPFVAQKHVLWQLELKILMRLSFLSKRSKRMIKQALPSKKAQYECIVWYKEASIIDVKSRFGQYSDWEPNIEHIIQVLSYPQMRVSIYGKDAVIRAAKWVKRYRNCVDRVSFPNPSEGHGMTPNFVIELNSRTKHCMKRVSFSAPLWYRKMILEFVNLLLELNVKIDLGDDMVFTCSPEEVRIENLNIFPISFVWSLNCQKLRIVDSVSSGVIAHRLISSWASSDISASSTIRQLIFELKESEKIEEWILEDRWKKSEEELQYPIYGKINEHYKMYHENRKVILFETHHEGKKLLVVDLEQYGIDV
ncbi:unnamed protein product [Caenorhabditis brenneri]